MATSVWKHPLIRSIPGFSAAVVGLSPSGFCGTDSGRRYKRFMSIAESTSSEAFERFIGGKCLRVGRGQAARDRPLNQE